MEDDATTRRRRRQRRQNNDSDGSNKKWRKPKEENSTNKVRSHVCNLQGDEERCYNSKDCNLPLGTSCRLPKLNCLTDSPPKHVQSVARASSQVVAPKAPLTGVGLLWPHALLSQEHACVRSRRRVLRRLSGRGRSTSSSGDPDSPFLTSQGLTTRLS